MAFTKGNDPKHFAKTIRHDSLLLKRRWKDPQNLIDGPLDTYSASIDSEVTARPVKVLPVLEECFEGIPPNLLLKKGPCGIMTNPVADRLERKAQVDQEAALLEPGYVDRIEHRSASGGDDITVELGNTGHHLFFRFSERALPILFKNLSDCHRSGFFNDSVRIDEGASQPAREPFADAGLANTHETNQDEVHPSPSKRVQKVGIDLLTQSGS